MNYNIQVDDLKKSALYIIRGMKIKRGKIEIDVNTAFDSASVSVTRYHKRIENGDEVQISERITVK